MTVVEALSSERCRFWVAGGWAVDLLAGEQTRDHRDLDLAVDADAEVVVCDVLGTLGYRVETEQRPIRVEFAAPGGRWVDLHPVELDASGDGVQAGPDGSFFYYPREGFVTGRLAGMTAPCLSAAQQLAFRSGYPPRPVDQQDVTTLRRLRQSHRTI